MRMFSLIAFYFLLITSFPLFAQQVFYVDSEKGDDAAAGLGPDAAWRSLEQVNRANLQAGDTVRFRRGGLWRGQLVPKSGEPGRPVTYTSYGEGAKPILQGSLSRSAAGDWAQVGQGVWAAGDVGVDAGILILNHGEAYGVKKWKPADLRDALDYWYDAEGKRVCVRCDANPAEKYASVELALTRHIVNQGNRHDVVYDGLAVRYGAAHGFGGGMTKRITIRNCDVYWIGGGLQFFKPDGAPVRYGNGIEFWDGAEDHLVERNRLWEIYDAALTNQGNGEKSHQVNIVYRNNVIWNAEYSFEFWNRPEGVRSHNIIFENNTCVNAGGAWSHAQRPDPNGAHLMFYQNPSDTQGFIIRNNIFCGTTDMCMRMENDWRGGLRMANNLYHTGGKPVTRWLIRDFLQTLEAHQQATGLDADSIFAMPDFVNPEARDYRLKPVSPGFKEGVGAKN
ncbi:MAG: hypothetical protein FWG50_08755 [Kiritimatiellaeota bacterium]|nr:hypothetical protein [Kiritimatiellota bacterium]